MTSAYLMNYKKVEADVVIHGVPSINYILVPVVIITNPEH